jgi:hypothetical protein
MDALPSVTPAPAPGSTFADAYVTSLDPLLVQLDGAAEVAADSLIDVSLLAVMDRVRCELSGRRVIVHGRATGLVFPYYTQAELDGGQLDTRYYTESEIDALFHSPPGVTPSSVVVGSGSASVAAGGLVSFTGASSVSLNGLFDGLGGDAYQAIACGVTSNGSVVGYRLRAAGTDVSGTVYNRTAVYTLLASGPTRSSATSSNILTYLDPTNGGSSAIFQGTVKLFRPAVNVKTFAVTEAVTDATADLYNWREASVAAASVADGLTLLCAQAGVTMTGWIKVVKIA